MKKIVTNSAWVNAILLAILLAGCKVMLIGAYDPVTDKGFHDVQDKILEIELRIEKNLNDAEAIKYKNFADDYTEIESEIASLQIRVASLPKYTQVVTHATELGKTVKNLDDFHKLGFGPNDTDALKTIRSTFEVEFKAIITLQEGLKRTKAE